MPDFPHLPLPQTIIGKFKFKGIPIEREVAEETQRNLSYRQAHATALRNAINTLSSDWEATIQQRRVAELPELPNDEAIPMLLKIDTSKFNVETLYSLGIDVIAETDSGYIIGAATDNFTSLRAKIDQFLAREGTYKNKASQLWEITVGNQWRIDNILSPELANKWDAIQDEQILIVDVSIACMIKIPDRPTKTKKETPAHFNKRYNDWLVRKAALEAQRDELEEARQAEFGNFIDELGGLILGSFVSCDDSFGCRVELRGAALKDLVLNYQYLFDVTEYDSLVFEDWVGGEDVEIDVELTAPEPQSPKICIIDSGIQEGHALLSPAVDSASSKSYLDGDASIADAAPNGGHGTKVAGGVLYGNSIPKTGSHDLDIWICNARVLDHQRKLPTSLFPPSLMEDVVNDFDECRVFNLSVTANRSSKLGFMSLWASAIDKIMADGQKLFVVATGNLYAESGNPRNPGIKEHLVAARNYPAYLLTPSARIAEPAQSCLALTVGSVCSSDFEDADRNSFGSKDDPSGFARTGPGIWNMIKPDVVEYGGDFIREKAANPNLTQLPSTSVEVVRTTLGGGNAVGYDIGSSFAAPKVSHIAGKILNILPTASANLVRSLIIQSARLPNNRFRTPTYDDLKCFGYGIPDATRATQNSEQRITMTAEGLITPQEAQLYTIRIPEEIRRAGNDYDVLVEVTLTFSAQPRRTRRRTNSYLSGWVDWQSSKLEESYRHFKARMIKYIDQTDGEENEPVNSIQWSIRENVNWGPVKNCRRQDSSAQKDWTIIKAYQLPSEFSIAIVGHKGWEKDILKQIPYSIAVSFEVLSAEVDIYNQIRLENEIEVETEVTV